jgi:hypothetical protein
MPDRRPNRRRLRRERHDVVALALLAVAAFAFRIVPVLAGGGLQGRLGYDDGVYFGAAEALVHGVLPYRDYLLLHPPGIVVTLVPFALLGNVIGDPTAFAVARVGVMALGALNCVLAALVAGRNDRSAGLLAGALYAAWSTAASAEDTTDLHAPQSTLVLLALLVLVQPGRVSPRRAVLAGLALGFATSIQVWQVVTGAVVLWWIVVRARGSGVRRFRPAAAYLAGAASVVAMVGLPFLAAAPEPMFRYVVVDQIGRPHGGVSLLERLRAIEGLPQVAQLPERLRPLVPDAAVAMAAAAALSIMGLGAWRRPWARPWVVLVVAQGALVMAMPSFLPDYKALLAPAACLALGTGLVEVGRLAMRRGVSRQILRGGVALLILALSVVTLVTLVRPEQQRIPIAQLERDVAAARCLSSDLPTLLIMTSALRRNLEHGCPVVLDPTGVRLDLDRGRLLPGDSLASLLNAPGYQRAMVAWYGGSDMALLASDEDLTPESLAAIWDALPMKHQHGWVTVRSKP